MTNALRHNAFAGRLAMPLAAAVGAFAIVAAAHDAEASAVAYSNLHISNLRIVNSFFDTRDASDFSNLQVGNSTNAEANLGGSGVSDDSLTSGSSDVPLQCLGAACGGIAENDFSQQSSGVFSRGDALLQGSLITGLEDPAPAEAESVGELRLDGDSASNGSTVGTTTSFEFALEEADTLIFVFEATPYLNVAVEDGTGQAQASTAFSITITDQDGAQAFAFAPDRLNTSRGQLNEGEKIYDPGTVSYTGVAYGLNSDEQYTLTINHQSETSGTFTAVPEPGTLMMLGAGLLGLGAVGRRRRSRA